DLLLRRGLREGHGRLPDPDRDRGRQEAAREGSAADGVRRDPAGRVGRRHGPQHLPVRRAGRDDPGRAQGRAREREARDRRPVLPRPEEARLMTTAFERIRAAAPTLTVGMATADLGRLGEEMRLLESTGVPLVHFDVMDGRFTPTMTFGPPLVAAVRTSLLKD